MLSRNGRHLSCVLAQSVEKINVPVCNLPVPNPPIPKITYPTVLNISIATGKSSVGKSAVDKPSVDKNVDKISDGKHVMKPNDDNGDRKTFSDARRPFKLTKQHKIFTEEK